MLVVPCAKSAMIDKQINQCEIEEIDFGTY